MSGLIGGTEGMAGGAAAEAPPPTVLPGGVPMREPYPSEVEFFRQNPHVGGMAAEDNAVILNPYSPLDAQQKQAVATNEAARVVMRKEPSLKPAFDLTPEQAKAFASYGSPDDQKATVAARILSGDDSALNVTPEQRLFADRLGAHMDAPHFTPMLEDIAKEWPALKDHLGNFIVKNGDEKDNVGGGHLEFYPPWESHNPHPGRSTIEIFDKDLTGKALQDAIAADALHLLGAKDPRNDQPIDPKFYEMKQQLLSTLTPEQLKVDMDAYKRDQARNPDDERTFREWMETSRGDAYIRGYIKPDKDNNWRDVYTPEQKAILDDMKAYLEKGSK